jgi:hypothetical protein
MPATVAAAGEIKADSIILVFPLFVSEAISAAYPQQG